MYMLRTFTSINRAQESCECHAYIIYYSNLRAEWHMLVKSYISVRDNPLGAQRIAPHNRNSLYLRGGCALAILYTTSNYKHFYFLFFSIWIIKLLIFCKYINASNYIYIIYVKQINIYIQLCASLLNLCAQCVLVSCASLPRVRVSRFFITVYIYSYMKTRLMYSPSRWQTHTHRRSMLIALSDNSGIPAALYSPLLLASKIHTHTHE